MTRLTRKQAVQGIEEAMRLNELKRWRLRDGRIAFYRPGWGILKIQDDGEILNYSHLQKWIMTKGGDVFNVVKRLHSKNPTSRSLGYKPEAKKR